MDSLQHPGSNHFKDSVVLITGGLGFIGSNLAIRLCKLGAKVRILDVCLDPYGWNFFNIEPIKDQVDFRKGDIRDYSVVKELVEGTDFVFHLAGQVSRTIAHEEPERDISINCQGTINVLEAIRHSKSCPKIVYTGSRWEYGAPEEMPVNESSPSIPIDLYGINKLTAETYINLYRSLYGIKAVCLRLNNVYGPRCQMKSSHYGVLNWFIGLALRGQKIPVFGQGMQTRDYVYIDDVVDALELSAAVDCEDHAYYLIGSETETRFIDMVEMLINAVGKGSKEHIPFPPELEKIDLPRFISDCSLFKSLTGWNPKINLKTGLKKTVAFYRKHLNEYI